MTKIFSLVSLAAISLALGAQTSGSPQTPSDTSTPQGTSQTQPRPQSDTQPQSDTMTSAANARAAQVEATSVDAELTKGLDAKRAHVGDEVDARTTSEAKLADGTTLPRGTKLVGNVVDVTAKSKQEKDSKIVIALNRAVLKDGKQVAIQSAVTSMTAPVSNSNANAAVVSAPSAPPASGNSSGGGSGSASSTPPPPSSPPMRSMPSDTAQSTPGQMLRGAGDQVPVGNKPTVILSAPTTPDSSAILQAKGENVSLESGTKLTLNVIPVHA